MGVQKKRTTWDILLMSKKIKKKKSNSNANVHAVFN